MKIYKNFLSEKEFNIVEGVMANNGFPWYYGPVLPDKLISAKDYNFQLAHTFYEDDQIISSSYIHIIDCFKKKIKWLSLLRAKANLLLKSHKKIEHGMHIDISTKSKKYTTGIFYLNNNNGYTKFKNGTIVKSERNKYVEFNGHLQHTGTTCTDKETRVILNLNYIK
jgi:hypothetical protein